MFIVISSFKTSPNQSETFLLSWNALTRIYLESHMLLNAYIMDANGEYIAILIWKSKEDYNLCKGLHAQIKDVSIHIENIIKACYSIEIKHQGICLHKNI